MPFIIRVYLSNIRCKQTSIVIRTNKETYTSWVENMFHRCNANNGIKIDFYKFFVLFLNDMLSSTWLPYAYQVTIIYKSRRFFTYISEKPHKHIYKRDKRRNQIYVMLFVLRNVVPRTFGNIFFRLGRVSFVAVIIPVLGTLKQTFSPPD